MVALALGHDPETPVPEPFHSAAQSLPDPRRLIAEALEALDIVGDPKRSELARSRTRTGFRRRLELWVAT